MTYLCPRSIMGISDEEVGIRMGYMYKILSKAQIQQIDENMIKMIFAFVRRLEKTERMRKILDFLINKLWSNNKLNLVPEDERDSTWSFNSRFKYHFYEDEAIGDKFSCYRSNNENHINFLRCIFAGGISLLPRILENVFFTNRKDFSFKPLKMPQRVKKSMDTLALTKFLVDNGALTENQAFFMQAVYRFSTTAEFSDYFNRCDYENSDIFEMIGLSEEQIASVQENLVVGVLNAFFDSDLDISKLAIACVKAQSLQPYFNDMSRPQSLDDAFPIESFSIKEDERKLVESFLKGDDCANILLYGAAGSGKTEFAKSIVKACGMNAIRFKNSYETENSTEAAISAINSCLAIKRKNTVFIIDEAESILETKPVDGLFGTVCRKASVNKIFERCNNKVIWIVNYTDRMDDSTKRRFTYSVKFDKMSEKNMEEIALSRLSTLPCSSNLKKRLLTLCSKYDVTGASVGNMMTVMNSLNEKDEEKIENTIKKVLESNSTLLYGQAKMREKTKSSYDISVLNSTVPAEEIVEMVENAKAYAQKNDTEDQGIRMLFYGLSGTGKTEFARYISQKLGKKILLKRASDIISKYVGDTEKNISEAFNEAEQNDMILLFDEADSFFRDREHAQYEWEITKVNEFLTQMEEFKGILICTTNLRKIMDKAMLRRFHICTEFKSLNRDGIEKLLKRYFPSIIFSEKQVDSLACYDSVTPGDFGAISGRVRFMAPDKITADYITGELIELQKEKDGKSGSVIGFVA
ncbi:MAG: AAA family ATPase [Treponema sp.]|uniref:AAA family ATPase n=1 Tax=Treponema sp. TaxID=166 RepID=UPI002A90D097|nr:AAA family ATPase [Treponema sp.]MDY6397125.1 AAA family ATPase [Treponema sp.]